MRAKTILVVDDDQAMQEMLVSLLEDHSFKAASAGSAEAALDLIRTSDYDAVISDIRMPGKDGVELLGEIREARPETPVILMTAYGSIDSAVAAMKAGAFDYITKPFQRDEVMFALERAFAHRSLEEENRRLRRAVDKTARFGDLIGNSPAMRDTFALIRKIANTANNVLITGESGTGKEVVARTIHFSGPRASKPFIPVNCTAIPEGLLESELFGHVRGAFTGAYTSKRGLFEEAKDGTLFLDEIGDLGPLIQAKLLRVLQDSEIRPVGGTQSMVVDTRVIAATNKDLREEIKAGRFRRDLFYRLNVIPVHIPPLRERLEDIPPLVNAFLEKHASGEKRTVTSDAMKYLLRHNWEGNARELENAIERALVLSETNALTAESLATENTDTFVKPLEDSLLQTALDRRMTLRELSDRYVDAVLELADGNKVQAARILGINRRTLYRRGDGHEEQPATS